MELTTDRRRFLQLAGTGGTLALAGCSAPSPGGALEATGDSVTETATVTVALEIDEEALQTARQDLVSKIQNGTLNQTQAQEQLYATERELLADAATAFRERVDGTETLTVEDAATDIGVFLVSGTPAALIESIGRPEVRGLFSQATFEQALAQQQASQ
jgi:hypothetical protein